MVECSIRPSPFPGPLAQLARALHSHCRGRRFEFGTVHQRVRDFDPSFRLGFAVGETGDSR